MELGRLRNGVVLGLEKVDLEGILIKRFLESVVGYTYRKMAH